MLDGHTDGRAHGRSGDFILYPMLLHCIGQTITTTINKDGNAGLHGGLLLSSVLARPSTELLRVQRRGRVMHKQRDAQ